MNTRFRRTKGQLSELVTKFQQLKESGLSVSDIRKQLNLSKRMYFRLQKRAYPSVEEKLNLDPSRTIPALKSIKKSLNPIEFCDEYLAIDLLYMQRLVIKAFYNLPLLEKDKKILQSLKNQGKTTWEEGANYNEIVLLIGMKGTKTTITSLIAQIEEYELFKLKDICKHYNLLPGERIYIKNVATNERQAEKTIFAKIQASIDRSAYFKARDPKLSGSTYHFRDTNVYIESGHSNSASLVGDTCKFVALDEADRFVNSKNGKYSAEEVYEALSKSTDPFKKEGKIATISSLVQGKGFMTHKFEQSKRIPSMLGFWMAEWEMKPEFYSGKTFFYKINIPIEHKDSFDKNPEKFLRDKACIVGYTIGAYYRMPDRIDRVFEQSHNLGYKNPIDSQGRFADWFKSKDNHTYYEHHDPSVAHDSYAIALGHQEKGIPIIDMIHRFTPEDVGEIDIEEVKEFCNELHTRFPNIEKITYDTWAASALMQSFEKNGIKTENLYIKKPQHDLVKEKVYTGNFRCHLHSVAQKELSELILSGEKVDHPDNGSKDCADAIAGVTWNCGRSDGVEAGLAVTPKEKRQKMGFKTLDSHRRKKIWE